MDLSIEDKYKQKNGTVFLTGMQAIIRLVLEKQTADALKGEINQTYFFHGVRLKSSGMFKNFVHRCSLFMLQY